MGSPLYSTTKTRPLPKKHIQVLKKLNSGLSTFALGGSCVLYSYKYITREPGDLDLVFNVEDKPTYNLCKTLQSILPSRNGSRSGDESSDKELGVEDYFKFKIDGLKVCAFGLSKERYEQIVQLTGMVSIASIIEAKGKYIQNLIEEIKVKRAQIAECIDMDEENMLYKYIDTLESSLAKHQEDMRQIREV